MSCNIPSNWAEINGNRQQGRAPVYRAPHAIANGDAAACRVLTPSKDNVRRFTSEAGIEELCANIAAMGLLQNLTGRRLAKGKFEIEARARRLRALRELAKRGAVIEPEGVKVTLDYLVPLLVKGADHNATELSLSENIVRETCTPPTR